jgi:hypothetical protein
MEEEIDPVLEVANFLSVKNAAYEVLNTTVSNLRLKFITPLPGQEMVYMAKAAQAKDFLVDPNPDPNQYLLIYGEVGITAPDALGVAQVFQGKATAWTQIASAIETIRLTAERDINIASTNEAVDTALFVAVSYLDQLDLLYTS